MVSLQQLIWDVDGSVERRSGEARARTLGRITDLFEAGATAFSTEQIELFDVVIGRFAAVIETRARVDLAERLARLERVPPGVLRALAEDEIVVARPILVGSRQLDDQALMAIALRHGRDHMLAICARPALSAAVTDVLVQNGDGVVRHAVAGHHGAALSPSGTTVLVGIARDDDVLLAILGERRDLPAGALQQLVAIAKERVRAKLGTSLPVHPGLDSLLNEAVERGGRALLRDRPAAPLTLPAAVAADHGAIDEADVARAAGAGQLDETIALMASLTGLSAEGLARIFQETENDLLIVIGRARGWRWSTVRALLRLRDPALTERHQFRRAAETFETMSSATASSVVHFLKVREAVRTPSRRRDPEALRYA